MNKSLEETDPDLFDIMEHEKVSWYFNAAAVFQKGNKTPVRVFCTALPGARRWCVPARSFPSSLV